VVEEDEAIVQEENLAEVEEIEAVATGEEEIEEDNILMQFTN
jgi:hypothetical protein